MPLSSRVNLMFLVKRLAMLFKGMWERWLAESSSGRWSDSSVPETIFFSHINGAVDKWTVTQ